jgi:thiamine biosynthesis lipoprotein
VARELAAALAAARDYGALTSGAFDVTVGPLVALWTEAARRDREPEAAELEAALARVGVEKLRVTETRAELPLSGMSIDLGGLAKGWALDRMRELLAAEAVSRAFVSFGQSSLLGLGAPPDAPGWRVLLRGVDRPYEGVVTLHDRALSVSASLGQWSEIGGRRYGHVLDPRSGRPLTQRREAAVVDTNATRAEALTKLLVLEPDEGLALLESLDGVEGILMEEGRTRRSSGWDAAVDWEPLEP